mmetsp:Transcript_29962/g.68036  ORF Transcript_29962/g.68036 Transcript_29962/m.68036 type:complete len:216 (+) Transcript_29962:1383-2030(+)
MFLYSLIFIRPNAAHAHTLILPHIPPNFQPPHMSLYLCASARQTSLVSDGFIVKEATRVMLKSGVKEVSETYIEFSNGDRLTYGFCVWAAGNGPIPLVLSTVEKVFGSGSGGCGCFVSGLSGLLSLRIVLTFFPLHPYSFISISFSHLILPASIGALPKGDSGQGAGASGHRRLAAGGWDRGGVFPGGLQLYGRHASARHCAGSFSAGLLSGPLV